MRPEHSETKAET